MTKKTVKSTCGLCYMGCGILLHMKNGKPTKIVGDPESEINRGKLCPKGLASLEYLYNPARLKRPLRRRGSKNKGDWEEISWNDALDIIASEMLKAKAKNGPESVAVVQGAAKGLQESYLARFANVFGTPNRAVQGYVCHLPKISASRITCGFYPFPDLEYPPACLIIWGINPSENFPPVGDRILEALEKGTKLIIVDPRKTELSKKAHIHLRIKPGSDLALALAMMNVIVNENLFDEEFVRRWTVGFDRLKTHMQNYPAQKMQEVTWLDEREIKEAARLYARNKPACIVPGNALDHSTNSFQVGRAISILHAITGNLGVPGGELECKSPSLMYRRSPELELWDMLPEEKFKRRINAEDGLIPSFQDTLPQSLIKAILFEDPYPIRVLYVQGCNPMLTYSNSKKVFDALRNLEFLAVADMFMTPTAALADVVLPVTSYLEHDSVVCIRNEGRRTLVQVQQKVEQIGECRSDYEILNGLAARLGLSSYFWENEEHCLDAILKPAGITFQEFRKIGMLPATTLYRAHEANNGFETSSRRVELYSDSLEKWGHDPLPIYREPSNATSSMYPYLFISRKLSPFRHSGGRQIESLRINHPDPVVTIHPETASRHGIREGDSVCIETPTEHPEA